MNASAPDTSTTPEESTAPKCVHYTQEGQCMLCGSHETGHTHYTPEGFCMFCGDAAPPAA